MAAFPCSHTRFRTNRLSLNTPPFYGLQLDEEVRFEQLSESWTCEPQHVRLHQIAILLGTYPRLLLHEVLFPRPPPPSPHPNPKFLALLPSLPLITRLSPAASLLSLFYHSVNAFVPYSLACLATFCCQPLPPLSAPCKLFRPFHSPSSGCF